MNVTHLTRLRWLAAVLVAFCAVFGAGATAVLLAQDAVPPVATNRFDVALRMFEDGAYGLAGDEFSRFIQEDPQSPRVTEAVLYQGQALYRQGDPAGCLELLRTRLDRAGDFAFEYRYWCAEALLSLGRLEEAGEAFGGLATEGSGEESRRLDAALGAAYAWYRLGDLRKALGALSNPDSPMVAAMAREPIPDAAIRGSLLLGEVQLRLGNPEAGLMPLARLKDDQLPESFRWEKQLLSARLLKEAARLPEALAVTTNLVVQVSPMNNPAAVRVRASAIALQGGIQEQSNDRAAALRTYERNLAGDVPSSFRLEAVQRIVSLTLDANQTDEAIARLEEFIRQYPTNREVDLMRLTLGELLLRQQAGLSDPARPASSNLLVLARSHFQRIATNSASPFRAQASLGLGWVSWADGAVVKARLADAISAFQNAAEQLPVSEDQAIARLKLGDCHFMLTNYPGATTNYWVVATNYSKLPSVSEALVPRALHQLVRVGIASGDMEQATRAMGRVLEEYSESPFSSQSMLAYGQALMQQGEADDARALFEAYVKRFPGSPLIAEAELELARTYKKEGNWPAAVAEYDRWVTNHVSHPWLPLAAYDRALGNYLMGLEEAAYQQFTNLISRFPRDPLAAWGQDWVAGHHYRNRQFDLAELNYQRVFQNTNWPRSELAYQARLMAGRSAFFRQGYADARGYYTNLINDPGCPKPLLPEAYFELGNTIMANSRQGGTNAVARYAEAIAAFSKIPQSYGDSGYVPLAWGQIGNCHLQLGQLTRALEAYTNVLASAQSEVATRAQARIGMAHVYEQQVRGRPAEEQSIGLAEALRHYLYVVDGLGLAEGESADPFWTKEAALGAALVAEELQQWDVSENLYRRLLDIAPAMQSVWQARIARLTQQREQPRGATP